jgi:formylglycine-generating enzyme required for sulfatase activity
MAVEDSFVPHGQAKDEPNAALTGGLSSISHAAEGESEEQSTAKVFISYSRKDIAFADRLEAALKARGFEPLIDRTEIYAFEEWWSRIEALIARADTVVFVLSPNSVASEVALKEVEFAASLNKRFAPIVFCSVQEKLVPEALAKLHFIFFDDAARFEQSADQLAAALNTDISWIRQHTEFAEQARRWVLAKAPVGLLLRSPALEQAEYWIAARPKGAPAPTEETRTFIRQSREAAARQKIRTRRVQGLIYALLVGMIVGLVGWINQAYIKEQWRWWWSDRPFVAANIWPYVLKPAAEQALKPKDSFRECTPEVGKDYCPEMVVVPAGSFKMGSPPSERGRFASEGPQRTVTIAKPFAVSKFEVTFDEWDTCVTYGNCAQGVSDNGWGRKQQPAIYVSWNDAKRYVAWLSRVTGKTYRLLTEAEYEYSTRAGTETVYPWGNEVGKGNANCNGCGSQWDNRQPAPVGSFAANGFGLYDMAGNVVQWVEDCFHPNYEGAPTDGSAWTTGDCTRRRIRGNSYRDEARFLRSASRRGDVVDTVGPRVGFRVARTLTP